MSFWEVGAELQKKGIPFVTVTLVTTRGHAPQDPGAKALVSAQGLEWGTVGGGKVEAKAITFAQEWINDRASVAPVYTKWNLQRDVGMSCGGEVEFLFEKECPSLFRVVVFGAGHVAQELSRILARLRCHVIIVDSRKEWLDRLEERPNIASILLSEPADFVEKCEGHEFFVVMTRGHSTDLPVLEAIGKKFEKVRYVGVIGSEVKSIKIRADLRKSRTCSESFISALRCPIGKKTASNDPAEIALSIAYDLVTERDLSI